jgi:hypothetical protein
MRVDFTALFGHALNWQQIETLPARLNERWSGKSMLPPARPGPIQTEWAFGRDASDAYASLSQEFTEAGHVVLKGPEGFDGQLFRKAFELYHWTRWSSFVTEVPITTALRQTCRLVAELLGTRTVIYLPDGHYAVSRARDLPYKGADLEEITAWLAQNAGPPAETIQQIAREVDASRIDLSAYFIDRF